MTGDAGIGLRLPAQASLAERVDEVLSPEALRFVADLQRRFGSERARLLAARGERRVALAAGGTLDFDPATAAVREDDWRVAPPPPALHRRHVEITGPAERKMIINALNSGANGFMADFEDALSPTFANVVGGQISLADAVAGTIEHAEPDGRTYRLNEEIATLLVRPRGWHLHDRHVLVDDEPIAGALLDFGLFCFHNGDALAEQGRGPFLYLPKLEHHLEARLWNDVLGHAEEALGLPPAAIRTTVLIETAPAAFQMDEILFELRERSAGLNAGRWDYIFSMIKSFRERPEFMLPDRASVTMTVPFMRAYTELLVRTCHRRGAHAIGGMAALIPSRRDPEANERALAGVRADKRREARDGFDGTWVAHPDLVEVARAEFEAVLGDRDNQVERQRDDVEVGAGGLLDVAATGGDITEAELRNNVSVGIQYIASWLRGNGAAAINGLMEDAATAEIARSQVWQWVHHGAALAGGPAVTPALIRDITDEEVDRLREQPGGADLSQARDLFDRVALDERFAEFLTLPAYEELDG